MATANPIRLPLRAILRSTRTNIPPSNHLLAASSPPLHPSLRATSTRSATDDAEKRSPIQLGAWSRKFAIELSQPRVDPQPPQPTPLTEEEEPRQPRAVQAAYLQPLRRHAEHGVPSCDLQLRSYSVRNLEFFCDFALRAAYYLGLPAYGPVPLPRIVERWTVPKGPFIHKKAQENFERKTLRRLIQIKDGDVETVEVWLAFLRKHAYYGIGMKANVWTFSKLGVGKEMDDEMEKLREELDPTLSQFAFRKESEIGKKVIEVINRENFRLATGGNTPMQHKEESKRGYT